MDQVVYSPATTRQIEEYRTAIARHAGDVATFFFTSKARALKLAEKANMLPGLVRDTLAVTRMHCYSHPSDTMEKVAFDNFDYFLNAIAERT
jgi:hypothetical protein